MMRIVNFAHGACAASRPAQSPPLPFWGALIIAPLAVGLLGMAFERTLIRRLTSLDPLYNLLLTFGLTLVIEEGMKQFFGMQGTPYSVPSQLQGAVNLGVTFYPTYRLFIIVFSALVCLAVWLAIERTPLGAKIRAATENPPLVQAFGINTSRLATLTFGFGVALAALAGVLAAPTTSVTPAMGSDIIITTFAVVVIGGMGSIGGAGLTRLIFRPVGASR